MVVPAHVGLEHPSLLWLVAIGVLAFVAGLWVNLRSPDDAVTDEATPDEAE
jgi:hypothetical protein